MRLIKFFVELRYRQPHRLFRVYDELYTSLVGKPPAEKEPVVLPGFGLTISDKRMRVVVDPQRSVADLEYVPNLGYCLDTVSQVFRKINDMAPLPELSRMGARSWWIRPVVLAFDTLVERYKQKMFQANPLTQVVVDVGASFVVKDGGYSVNISTGPMPVSQLKSMLSSPPGDLPDVLAFLDVDYSKADSEMKYDEKDLQDFVRRAFDFYQKQQEIVDEFLKEVER